MNQNNTNK